MAVRLSTKKRVSGAYRTDSQRSESPWSSVRGMWKKKIVDAVEYQKRLRKEADTRR